MHCKNIGDVRRMTTPLVYNHTSGLKELISAEDLNKWVEKGQPICGICKHINCLCHVSGSKYYIGEKDE